jgi:hypothetical protein
MPPEARARTVELRARRQSCNFPTFAATAESKDFALPRLRDSRPQTNKGNSAAPRHRSKRCVAGRRAHGLHTSAIERAYDR